MSSPRGDSTELVDATKRGLRRMETVVTSLADEALGRALENGWTVAATLAHLAFWDRWVEARWTRFARTGAFDDLPDDVADLVNEAAMAGWHAVPAREAVRLCADAAASVTRTIERLSPRHVDAAVQTGRLFMIDRTRHWCPHLDEIERSTRHRAP